MKQRPQIHFSIRNHSFQRLFHGLLWGQLGLALCGQIQSAEVPLSGKVADYLGRPTIFINDQPVAPMIYAGTEHSRFTWKETPHRNLANFAQAGYRLFQVDVWFRDIWRTDGSLDLPIVRRQIHSILEVCPEAAVFVRIHLDPPGWWMEQHPTEAVAYADAGSMIAKRANPPQSLASTLWLDEATRQLEVFCKELAPLPEGCRVVGLHLAGGLYGEWHYHRFEAEPDTSAAMTRQFQKWLKARYGSDATLRQEWHDPGITLATATVPGLDQRNQTADGFFRDPTQERQVIDYYFCQQDLIADDVLHFCRVARSAWPRPLVIGSFYGYLHTMVEMGMPDALQGTFERALNSPDLDYLSGPLSYQANARDIGGSGMVRTLPTSLQLHGKLWLSEMDEASSLGNPWPGKTRKVFHSLADTVAGNRRNFAFVLTSGMGQWWYDFGPKLKAGWWDNPQLMDDMGAMLRLSQAALQKTWHSAADVLLVYDFASYNYQARTVPLNRQSFRDTLSSPLVEDLAEAAYHTGAAVDQVASVDLPRVDLARYKVVVFGNVWLLTDTQRTFLRDHVMRDGRTVVWQYAPGITDGWALLSTNAISAVVGIRLKPVDLAGAPKIQLLANAPKPFAGLKLDYGIAGPIHPLLAVADQEAEKIGNYSGTTETALALRRDAAVTIIYSGLPITDARLLQAIFRLGGAHIYNDEPDVLLADNNYVCVHTLGGGIRRLVLRDGKILQVQLFPRSTQIFDAITGESVLPGNGEYGSKIK